MTTARTAGLAVLSLVLCGGTAAAGTYIFVPDRVVLDTMNPNQTPAFSIVHPRGYTGGGGNLGVTVCVLPGSEALIPAVKGVIATWNALIARTDNCDDCGLFEEAPFPSADYSAYGTLLHEIGHCGLGLGHANFIESVRTSNFFRTGTCDVDSNDICGEGTSFTASANETEIDAGTVPLGLRGNEDDNHFNKCFVPEASQTVPETSQNALTPAASPAEVPAGEPLAPHATCPTDPDDGTQCCPDPPRTIPWDIFGVAWFRTADNDPFVVDSLVIDKDTYSRNRASLPPLDLFPLNANRKVGENLLYPRTQAVMYAGIAPESRFWGLSADDVNMVKMAMTGADRDAGTADDYTITLLYEPDCAQADIRVDLGHLFVPLLSSGACISSLSLSFPQPLPQEFHWSMVPANDPMIPGSSTWLLVELNDLTFSWDFSVPIFRANFETGLLSEWSNTCPPTCSAGEPPPPIPPGP